MKLTIKFPFIRGFSDYHEIDYYAEDLNEIFVDKVKGIELGLDYNSRDYIGLFYIGQKPPKEVINKLLKQGDICFDEPQEEIEGADEIYSAWGKEKIKLGKSWKPDGSPSLFFGNATNNIPNEKDLVDRSKKIKILFDYPLEGEYELTFKNKKGFTKKDFIKAVKDGYRQLNKHLSGHSLSDLGFEGATKVNGTWVLDIGS